MQNKAESKKHRTKETGKQDRYMCGETVFPAALSAETISARPPQAAGDDMLRSVVRVMKGRGSVPSEHQEVSVGHFVGP